MKNSHILTNLSLIVVLSILTWFSAEPHFRGQALASVEQQLTVKDAGWRLNGGIKKAYQPVGNNVDLINPINARQVLVGTWELDKHHATEYLHFSSQYRFDKNSTSPNTENVNIFLSFRNEKQTIYGHSIAKPSPAVQEQQFSSFIKVPQEAKTMRLIMIVKEAGTWALEDIRFQPAKISLAYKVSIFFLACLWLGVAIVWLNRIIKTDNIWPVFIVTIVVSIIFAGVLASRQAMRSILIGFVQLASRDSLVLTPAIVTSLFDYGHCISFMLLTLIVLYIAPKLEITRLATLAYLFALAALSEIVQRHSLTRSPQWADLVMDGIGIVAGVLVFGIFRFIFTSVKLSKAG